MDQDITQIAWEQATHDLKLRGNPNQATVVVPTIDLSLDGIAIGEGTPLQLSSRAAVQMDGSFHPSVGVWWPGLPTEIHLDLVGTPYAHVLRFCILVDACP